MVGTPGQGHRFIGRLLNKFYLTRIFKEQFGTSINSYLIEKRITHAKQLLRFTDKSVESIGMECGMGAPYYFSRMFKNVEGDWAERISEDVVIMPCGYKFSITSLFNK